ncbi:MAG: hypothetical protein ACLGG0_08955 [Bacteriovoracia bacterium]
MSGQYLSEREVFDLLSDFESKHNPYNLWVNDVSVWQILRPRIASKLQNAQLEKASIPKIERFLAYADFFSFIKLLKNRGVKYCAFTNYSGYRNSHLGRYEDIWFDHILDNFPGGVKIARIDARGFRNNIKQARIKPLYDISTFEKAAGLLSRVAPIQDKDAVYEKVTKLANKLLGHEHFTSASVQIQVSRFFWISRFYRIILKLLKPKKVIFVGTNEFALIHASKKEKIRSIEFQHGIFSKHHAYTLPLLSESLTEKLIFPDVIGLYGKFWESELRGTIFDQRKILNVLGNFSLEKYKKMRIERFKNSDSISIIVTTQGIEREKIIIFFKDFLKSFSRDLRITFKLHPSYDPNSSAYDELKILDSRVTILSGNEGKSTFELIALSDLHLSIASACHYDSLSIGTPTLVLAMAGAEIMEPIIRSGYSDLLYESSDLIRYLDKHFTKPIEVDDEFFCKKEFFKNLERLM